MRDVPDVHIKTRVLEIRMKVDSGSPTEVTFDIVDCGGFLAAYGDVGIEKLRSLKQSLARSAENWFQSNQADLSSYHR